MSDLLTIGASGLRAYRDALATTGDNIANVQTPGYARRSVRLADAAGGGDVVLYRNAIRPGGVRVDGIMRAVDAFRVEDARVSSGAAGRASVRLEWIEAAERALDDGVDGIGKTATAIFNAADRLASDPASLSGRAQFLGAVDSGATAFRRTATGLQQISQSIADAGQATASQIDGYLTALQRVNDGLRRARDGSTNQASLLDERDRLLDSLSAALPVTAVFDARQTATVSLAGAGGVVLLDGNVRASATIAAGSDGRLTLTLSTAIGPILPSSGSVGGLIDAAAQVATRREQIDVLAANFAADLNAAHANGFDANGNAGQPLLTIGSGAASLLAVALTPERVAAADSGSDNGNMLALSALRGNAGVENGWAGIVSVHAQGVAAARAEDSAAASRRDGAIAARDDVSGVDLDSEAAELLRFQQAYEGSARVIQVAREIFQSIINAI